MFLSKAWSLLRMTWQELWRHPVHRMAAALAFFALFALPPLALVLMVAGGEVLGDAEAREALLTQVEEGLGGAERDMVATVIDNTPRPGEGDLLTQLLSLGALLFGATAGFHQLQLMLNAIWEVPRRRGLWRFISTVLKRSMSFLLVIASGTLVLALFGTDTLATAFPETWRSGLPPEVTAWLQGGLRTISIFLLMTIHFALVFKVLPDTFVPWMSALIGALLTAALFFAAKEVVGLYLQHSNLGTVFGAAGSLVVSLIWIYAAALLLLLGGVFTRAYSRWRDALAQPPEGSAPTTTP